MSPSAQSVPGGSQVRFIPLSYDGSDSDNSARKLILTLMPSWASDDSHVEFNHFTDGITNTLLKATNARPGMSKADIDRDSILLRAYGNGTDVIIDREREAANHELLMQHNLAPPLLARFSNGMLYRFIPGIVCTAKDLPDPTISKAVARRLAQFHATVPCVPDVAQPKPDNERSPTANSMIANAAPGKPIPSCWSTMQKWILALPVDTDEQRQRQSRLQDELHKVVERLANRPTFGANGLVFAHCDLLCANIIQHRNDAGELTSVSFIDYEYATPSPAAFDIANHFAEWVGYDCDYAAIPGYSQRLTFVREYIQEYAKLTGSAMDVEAETAKMMTEVDAFRGVPGFFWGIWSVIQSTISKIDFDYASYAELRLAEYWDALGEQDGSRAAAGKEMSLREKTWSRE